MIPLSRAPLTPAHHEAVRRALDSGWFILGEECTRFEAELASYFGVAHAVLCGSATAALTLTLAAWGIGPGDEVIVPSLTAFPTAEAVYNAGATPVYADVDEHAGLDAEHARALVTPRTRAIVPVHLYGQAVDLDAVQALAGERGLHLVEDCAQAHGATWRGRRVGSYGRAAALSFYPSKNLTVFGDGGCVLTSDAATAAKVRQLRDHGRTDRYTHALIGVNSRFNDVQAALGRVSLANLEANNAARRRAAERYRRLLADVVTVPEERDHAGHAWHLFVVRVPAARRDATARALHAAGVQTGIHYPVPCHRQPAVLARGPQAALPRTERLVDEILSLPMHPGLTDAEVEAVATALRRALA